MAYILPLGARPLFQPDELRYAEIPREMLASGDWVVPRLDGLRYFEKPVLGYWLTATSMLVLGENRFAARLPDALAAGITVLTVFLLVQRFGGVRRAAAAAGVLLTSGLFYAVGTLNVLDMPLTMFLTVALALFCFAWSAESTRRKAFFLALAGVAAGCAFLTKGFLAFAMPAATVVPFMLWERRTGKLLRLAWIPALTAALVALPWSLMIAQREPDFWHQFFWEEHVRRFVAGGHAQHAAPFWFFVPILLAGALPWTLFAPAAISGLRSLLRKHVPNSGGINPAPQTFNSGGVCGAGFSPRTDSQRPIREESHEESVIRFAICWLAFPFFFFSMSSGKLETYILPCFPPLALLIGAGLVGYLDSGRRKAFAVGAWALLGAFSAGGLALLVGRFAGIRQWPYGRDEELKWLILLGSLAFGVLALWRAVRPRVAGNSLAWMCAAPCLLLAAGPLALPKSVEDLAAPEAFLAQDSRRVAPGAPLFARAAVLHAVTWTYKRADVYVLESTGEADYGLKFPDAQGRMLKLEAFARFVAQYPATGFVTAIMDRHFIEEPGVKARLPKAEFEDMNEAVVFAQYRGGSGLPPRRQDTRNDR